MPLLRSLLLFDVTMSDRDVSDHESVCSSDSLSGETSTLTSLQDELQRITSHLSNFQPELSTLGKKKPGRPKKQVITLSAVNDSLNGICGLVSSVIKRLDFLEAENTKLKSLVNLDRGTPSVGGVATAGDNAGTPAVNSAEVQPTIQLSNFDYRLDQVEQEALGDCVKIDGDLSSNLISNYSNQPTKDHQSLKKSLVTVINGDLTDFIAEEDILSIKISGSERKHLKVKLANQSTKVRLIKSIKSVKPQNLFINDYLTKARSELLYKLRLLKKSHNSRVNTVYCFGGNVCCRLVNNKSKVIFVNTIAAYEKIVSLLNE